MVGADRVLSFSNLILTTQDQIAQILQAEPYPACIVYPRTRTELAAIVTQANQHQWRLLICGQGSKLHWGGLTQNIDLLVSTQDLNQVIDHVVGDLTVTAEAGVTLATLQKQLAKTQQFLALDPAYPDQATLGGLLATRDTGSWRHRYGSLRDMCLGMTLVRADGQVAKAGGRVVKNVAGYDLMKLVTGSYGTLGVIAEMTLRLYPLPESSTTVILTGSQRDIAALTRGILNSTLTPTAVDLLSGSALKPWHDSGELGLVVRLQSLPESVAQQCDRILHQADAQGLSALTLGPAEESGFWQQITHQFWQPPSPSALVCKLGVLPAQATQILTTLTTYCQQQGLTSQCRIHASSGTGALRIEDERLQQDPLSAVTWVQALRSQTQQAQGYLSVLEAPPTLKQALDIWGYTDNAFQVMQSLKQQFDPKNILNPARFVGGL
ncbi:MAG: FAD-binding oxidoreductase [Acaryochloris sp. CRU_2_0]|nr:FAD-binding oxidoreductase [Acaryochloris sp. CRU_2_0]